MHRRRFLQTSTGIVATAAAWGESKAADLHHGGKVKSIIFYYCKGGPSQAHTFDRPKKVNDPALYPWSFSRCGQSGLEISDLFPGFCFNLCCPVATGRHGTGSFVGNFCEVRFHF